MAAESRANGSMSEVELVRVLLAINSAVDARARVGPDRPSIPAPVFPPCDMSDSTSIGLTTNRV